MSVVCATCHTPNRDNAMFCRGCAGKLPAFAATGPSALEALRTRLPSPMPVPTPPVDVPRPPRRIGWPVWVAMAGLVLLCLFAWRQWHAVKSSVPPAARSTDAPKPAAPPAQAPPPAAPVALDDSLSRGEAVVQPGPQAAAPSTPAAQPPATARAPGPRVQPPPARVAAADPRIGCEHLNFVFAARCEAAHCDQPAYTRHPRCDLVREERRRDEARRNPTLGF